MSSPVRLRKWNGNYYSGPNCYSREELVGKSKILPVGEKDHEILEFLIPGFLKRKVCSKLGNRYYSMSSDWEKEASKDLESKKAVWRKDYN